MKIKELKNKIVLAELEPNTDYIMLVNPAFVQAEFIDRLQVPEGVRITFIPVHDVEKAIRFVEVPKKKSK